MEPPPLWNSDTSTSSTAKPQASSWSRTWSGAAGITTVAGPPVAEGTTIEFAAKVVSASSSVSTSGSGTSDIITNVRGRDVPAAKQIAHATYIESPFQGNKHQFFFNATKPPFKDNLKRRQAINHAVDRAALAKALGGGLGIPLPYELVPGSIG